MGTNLSWELISNLTLVSLSVLYALIFFKKIWVKSFLKYTSVQSVEEVIRIWSKLEKKNNTKKTEFLSRISSLKYMINIAFFPAYIVRPQTLIILIGTDFQFADYCNSLILPENSPIFIDNLTSKQTILKPYLHIQFLSDRY